MPLIIFTYTSGAMSKERATSVCEQIRESMIRNYVLKAVPYGLRAHTRMKLIETPRDCYIGGDTSLPLYDVELIGPIECVVGEGAECFAREVTTAILTAEGAPVDDDNGERVWCTFRDMPDGRWSIGKRVMGRRSVLKHILRYQSRHSEHLRSAAE